MEQKAISSDLIRGHIDTIILYSLMDGDKFAQQISDSIEEKSNGDYKMIQATLYSSLKRLESLKLVTSYWFDSVDVGGRRKFFSITESGKETVKSNIDSWSFSRGLIDKLVDQSPTPVYKTQIVEKIVEVPVEVQVPVEKIVEIPVEKVSPVPTVVEQEKTVENVNISTENVEKNTASQEVNFRNVLNSLIKSSSPKKEVKEATELKPVEKNENRQENSGEKLDFNDTISNVDYNEKKSNNTGKIDFGDLVLKAAKEGYKIRISSKDSSVDYGKLLINKLNFSAILITFFVALIEFFVAGVAAGGLLKLNAVSIFITSLILAIAPIVYTIRYIKAPRKRTNKHFGGDGILVSGIVVFNLVLITFACALLFNVDFSNKINILAYILIPGAIYFDILFYSVVKYFLSKRKAFSVKARN